RTMKRISVSYVYYFNKKYNRIGHLFQDRYRSEAVEEDSYILGAVRYIHNNPVKAKMVKTVEEYQWSSYKDYIGNDGQKCNWLESSFILSMLSDNKEKAIERFKEFSKQEEEENQFLENHTSTKENQYPIENVKDEIIKILENNGQNIKSLKDCNDKKMRNYLLREIKKATNRSVRELSGILGISKDIIFRA
ncbi:transposase, partial [Anaerosolibacter sp.]|uniref:transposase n=1 Tax=Anaerosolibacter sp. TaxID=1872527 RepID=UPI0039F134BB